MCEDKENTVEQASSLLNDKASSLLQDNLSSGLSESFRTYRRNLPHWEMPGSIYFITFRTVQGFVLEDHARDIVLQAICFHKDKKYALSAAVIMPDHAHLILQPLKKSETCFYSLAEITHSIKSYSAKQVNKALSRSGSVWLDESFDRIIRDDNELAEKLNYVLNNPFKAGLCDKERGYKWMIMGDK